MSSLVNWVKKHPIIYYAGAVYRLGKTVEGRRKVIGILTNPRSVEIEKRGDLHKGMLVCEIDPVVAHSGFFAVFRRLLSALYFSDEIGAKPYVAYSKDFIYAEDHPRSPPLLSSHEIHNGRQLYEICGYLPLSVPFPE